MNGFDYYKALNAKALSVFEISIVNSQYAGEVQDFKMNIFYWRESISKFSSEVMLGHAIEELDISCLQALQGLYRGAFASLRLSLEMICGAVYFSAHDIEYIEYIEWQKGSKDLVWAKINCPENGILSKRFCNAYFESLGGVSQCYIAELKGVYRELSEMVHGNNSTRKDDSPSIPINAQVENDYLCALKKVKEVSNFILTLRFLKSIESNNIQDLEPFITDLLQHVEPIRVALGGPASE
ncbi:Uncharacterised protein [Shewanella baltica]|nr:Uncharacterised protein [Shewanella baltica]